MLVPASSQVLKFVLGSQLPISSSVLRRRSFQETPGVALGRFRQRMQEARGLLFSVASCQNLFRFRWRKEKPLREKDSSVWSCGKHMHKVDGVPRKYNRFFDKNCQYLEIARPPIRNDLFESVLGRTGAIKTVRCFLGQTLEGSTDTPFKHGLMIVECGNNIAGHPRVVHGGFLAIIADQASGMLASVNSKSHKVMTKSLSITFSSPAKPSQPIIASVTVDELGLTKKGKEKLTVKTQLLTSDSTVVAEIRSIFIAIASKLF